MRSNPHFRNYALALLLLTLTAAAFGQAPSTPQPKVSIAQTEFNFGEVKEGVTVSHTFIVRNKGAANLEIKSVRPACGCTASDFDKVVAPGQEGKITLNVKTTGFHGAISKFADVTTSDPDNPNFTLTMVMLVSRESSPEGQRVGSFLISPSSRWKGRLAQGNSDDVMFSIVNDAPQPVRVTKVSVDGKAFTATLQTLEEGRRYLIIAKSSETLKAGNVVETLRVTTESREFPELQLQLDGNVEPAVSALPKALNFGVLPISNPAYDVSRTGKFLFVRLARGSGLEIKKVSSTLPFLKIEALDDVKGQSYRVLVMFDKEKLAKGEYSGKIILELNNPLTPILEIPVTLNAQ
ncbi:MAG TPA: DUF1573 domain-containing protein [Blastocatellia bacterium]|nr:DUF1573 domain-containing protein [Blastocatellia bacterium]